MEKIFTVMRGLNNYEKPVPYVSGPYAPALLNDFSSDIKQPVRVMPSNDLFVTGNNSYNDAA